MKINEKTLLEGNNVILVPYNEYHVEKYHLWMQSEELQELTASEPLTLDEEYKMQASWRNDEDKCTFIVLDKCLYENSNDEIESMVGDTNLFISDDRQEAEVEIMIAEKQALRKGFGIEAASMMILYSIENLNIKHYVAKIGFDNVPSVRLFNKMGFVEVNRNEIFKEIHLRRSTDDEWIKLLRSFCSVIVKKHERRS